MFLPPPPTNSKINGIRKLQTVAVKLELKVSFVANVMERVKLLLVIAMSHFGVLVQVPAAPYLV